MEIFVYGTLLDAKIRRLVAGSPLPIRAARARGFAVRRALGRRFPILVARRAGSVRGGVIPVPEGAALRRLVVFETGYVLGEIAVSVGGRRQAAQVFLPAGPCHKPTREGWRLGPWRERDRAAFLFQIRKGLASSPRS